ncbi:protein VTE6, chloroplastic isoform X2 [Hevea brasiliensis]|uniref:protein VTE6, chloroplastic isoform X2 n=1 Tax=Hevea brasiliensis TaxID=3981 RepID=UPI0025E01CF1|nr:protein VTE6, chloroplastic isoform X2 [Hevea brasiliensis]
MALSALLYVNSSSFPPLHFAKSPIPLKKTLAAPAPSPRFPKMLPSPHRPQAFSLQGALSEAMNLIQSSPPTWRSAFFNNLLIFTGTAATKVKMAQKEAQGVAEKRKGRRGPGSVIGSSAAGCLCAFLLINRIGGEAFSRLWELGFVASFCTKLSDTVSSEIGKAYGKTTYLVTTFKVVPRGTEGAVSVEGTLAGLLASILLASIGCFMGEIRAAEAVICVIASQIANFGESIIGASLQGKEGFQWLNNDVVNVLNISMGSILAVLMKQVMLQNFALVNP